jgi:hypothetical protein
VGQRQAAFSHHLDQVAQAELEAQVPSHAQNDDLAIKVATCEQLFYAFAPARTDPSIRPALKLTESATAICTRTVLWTNTLKTVRGQ